MDLDIILERFDKLEHQLAELREAKQPDNKALNAREAAEWLNISLSYLRRLCSERKLPYYRSGGGKLVSFRISDLEAFRTARRITPQTELSAKAATKIVATQGRGKPTTQSAN
jgi:excisionase family DNA binding protein